MAKSVPPEVARYLSEIGKRGGAIGGKRAAENMTAAQRTKRAKKASDAVSLTPAERTKRAKNAAAARWAKPKAKKK